MIYTRLQAHNITLLNKEHKKIIVQQYLFKNIDLKLGRFRTEFVT